MARKIAGASALVAFAICLVLGIAAGNTFATTVSRGLAAMAGTFVVGLVLGGVGEKMYAEHVQSREKLENSKAKITTNDR